MLWQDRNGNWFSTKSTLDIKIERAMIEANATKSGKKRSVLVIGFSMKCSAVN
jgi:hypothetical protein